MAPRPTSKFITSLALLILCAYSGAPAAHAGNDAPKPPTAAVDAVAAPGVVSPLERVNTTEKGKLRNPLEITPEIIEEGKELYRAKTCGACHGPNGSGIHCPSLKNDAWVYGSDDDTIFRLVALGSEKMSSQGYTRGDKEKHAGPMPGFSETIPDERDLWKIIAFIRSLSPDRGPQ